MHDTEFEQRWPNAETPEPMNQRLLDAAKNGLAHCLAWQGEPREDSCSIHKAVVADMRDAIAAAEAAQVKVGTIGHVSDGPTTLTGAIAPLLAEAMHRQAPQQKEAANG